MRINTFLLGFVALCVAFAAAFFSVTGLSKLFAGASLAVILMAGSLETAKLVVASYLHNRWKEISKLMRFYLVTAVVVLIGITSAGIYGFLTSAYQTTADELQILDRQVEVIELKKDRFQEQLDNYNEESNQLNQSISSLTEGLSNNQIQYTDSLGNVITTTSSATRTALTEQLENQREQRSSVRQNIEALTDSVTNLDVRVLELQQNNEVAAEIGPLKYIAEISGQPMNRIVNWFALLIVFVFDPLAVAMVISFNHALLLDRAEKKKKDVEKGKKKGYKVYNEGDNSTTTSVNVPNEVSTEGMKSGIIDLGKLEGFDKKLFEDIHSDKEESINIEKETKEGLNEELKKEFEEDIEQDIQSESEKKKVDETESTDLDNLKRDYSRRPIRLGDGQYVDGFDTDGDGMIDEYTPHSSMRAYHLRKGHLKPYYTRNGFDWNNKDKWIDDQNAVNYYLTYVKGNEDPSSPDDFTTKTY